mmetsp:Transcript_3473/g.5885  ORF Transcript_3473/g.5885 Transcript_3473/m.5885 type:complete len:92 (-) Transcript_3473:1367-1642(-)
MVSSERTVNEVAFADKGTMLDPVLAVGKKSGTIAVIAVQGGAGRAEDAEDKGEEGRGMGGAGSEEEEDEDKDDVDDVGDGVFFNLSVNGES